MKVSIVIPAYNVEKWIKKCLESVIKQSYNDLEIIVVNDGSTDNTKKILDDFSELDNRIKVINKENSGTYFSRKIGIQASTGDVIMNMDSDDFLELNAVEVLVNTMKASNADIVFGNHFQVIKQKKRIVRNEMPLTQNKVELLRYILNGKLKACLWGKLYKKELLLNIDVPINVALTEDVLANLFIFLNHNLKISIVDIPIYNYVIHSISASSSKNPLIIESAYEQISIAKKMIEEAGLYAKLSDELASFNCRAWIVYCRMGGRYSKDRKFYKKFLKENYTTYAKSYIPHHQKIEILIYSINFRLGLFATKFMKMSQAFFLKINGD